MKIPRFDPLKLARFFAACLLFCTPGLFLIPWIRPFLSRGESRNELLKLRSEIRFGETVGEVLKGIERNDFKYLEKSSWAKFSQDNSNDVLAVKTPSEFGSSNWVLLIEFKNLKVNCIRIRTEDTFEIKPANAPEDICR